jgi:hypothetical protein
MLSPTFQYIHPAFEIPMAFQATLFPNASLSVLEFLQFPLSVISGAAPQHDATVEDINIIQTITIPLAAIIDDLVAASKQAVISRSKSVKCLHSPSASSYHFPMWIITYWVEVLKLHITSWKAWLKLKNFCKKKREYGKSQPLGRMQMKLCNRHIMYFQTYHGQEIYMGLTTLNPCTSSKSTLAASGLPPLIWIMTSCV